MTDAINQALNDVILTEIQLVGGVFDNLDEFAIGYSVGSGNNVNVVIGSYDGADWVNSGTAVRDADTFIIYAELVPEPSAGLLGGSALGVLGVLGWMRRKAA